MSTRNGMFILALGALLLGACGSGSSTTSTLEPLNAAEKSLVGTYRLDDFSVWDPGCAPMCPADLATWNGQMELRSDRTARVCIEMCEEPGTPRARCDREFVWTAEAAMIDFHSTDTSLPDVRQEWTAEGMGAVETHSFVPTNEPDAGLLLFEGGRESFRWVRVQ